MLITNWQSIAKRALTTHLQELKDRAPVQDIGKRVFLKASPLLGLFLRVYIARVKPMKLVQKSEQGTGSAIAATQIRFESVLYGLIVHKQIPLPVA